MPIPVFIIFYKVIPKSVKCRLLQSYIFGPIQMVISALRVGHYGEEDGGRGNTLFNIS
jgi:hypothetical protein